MENTKNVMDIQFEPVVGLIAAVSSSNGIIRLIDIRTGNIFKTFKSDTFQRDTKLFWSTNNGQNKPKFYNQLICLGFGKGSVRKFTVYDLTESVTKYYDANATITVDEQKEDANGDEPAAQDDETKEESSEVEELENIGTRTFGVSNAIPIGHYDGNDNLFYVSSIGDRKIRVYEINSNDKSGNIQEMNASFQSKEDIMGIVFGSKQSLNIKKVEMTKCYKLSKDGMISPISFIIPRKRTEFFQDDLYSDVLDQDNNSLDIDVCTNEGKLNIDVSYVSLKPQDMELLSNAPEEEQSVYQKRRNSQIKIMEAEKLKEQPKSTEQAFDQFARMVADAPTANRWDAENIGTEVAEDEWSD